MPHYLQQVAYSIEGWKALVKKPQNRIEAVRPAIEKLGGKIESAWFTFGDYDVVLIVQMPSNVDASAIAMAFAAGGACKSVKTTPLLTVEEAVEAMKKATGSGYRAATWKSIRSMKQHRWGTVNNDNRKRRPRSIRKFYSALDRMLNGDAGPLGDIWSHSATVTTMHPIGGREVVWDQVRGSSEQVA
jgi:uncharacterized protein with GYD domain